MERKVWKWQDLAYHLVPTSCISRNSDMIDLRSGSQASQWGKLKYLYTHQICSNRSEPCSFRLMVMTPVHFCICDPLKCYSRSYNDVIRSTYVFTYNFWLDWDRDIGKVPKCSSRLAASNYMQHEHLRSGQGHLATLTWPDNKKWIFAFWFPNFQWGRGGNTSYSIMQTIISVLVF